MTDKMKNIFSKTGWLVMAAALTMGMTACSNEDNAIEEQPTQTTQTVHVTVGAGIDDGTTRATVEQDGTTRTLKFTAGDKLWVWRIIQGTDYYTVYGQLAIGTIGTDGTTAQFSGNLTVNKWNSNSPDLDLSSLKDYTATLVPAGSTYIKVQTNPDNGEEELIREDIGIATGELNDLMATNTYVKGTFTDASNVTLKARTAFFNCTVTGLEASTAYNVGLNKKDNTVSITTDGSGNLHFLAWLFLNDENEGVPCENIRDLRFYIGTNKRVILGSKTLYAKVYNVTRAAETYTPFTVTDNTTGNTVAPENGMSYDFKEGNADITVSGENEDQTITLKGSNDRVVMSGVTATCYEPFIREKYDGGTLNVELSGANSITITDPYGEAAITTTGPLYLSGNGTLTVTVATTVTTNCYGLFGRNYKPADNSNTDASVLAAPGCTVTRSARTDNDADNNGEPESYSWTYTVTNPLLAGKFTVSNDQGVTTQLVSFSRGNLQATYNGSAWSWDFATNQWDYIGGSSNGSGTLTGNNFITGNGTVSQNGTVDLFGWSTLATTYGIHNSTDYATTYSGEFRDWGANIGDGNTWRTLTHNEWSYLFDQRTTGGTVGTTAKACYTQATIRTDVSGGVNGLILFPDGVNFAASEFTTLGTVNAGSKWGTKCTTAQWNALAAKGCVFLPAAGCRVGASVTETGTYGYYWSSSPFANNTESAYDMNFHSNLVFSHASAYRNRGYSVRLVKNVQP